METNDSCDWHFLKYRRIFQWTYSNNSWIESFPILSSSRDERQKLSLPRKKRKPGRILRFFRDSRGARITRRNRAAAPVTTRTRVAALRRNRRWFRAVVGAVFRPRSGWPRCTRPSTTTRICTRWTRSTPSHPSTTPPIWRRRYCTRLLWWVK